MQGHNNSEVMKMTGENEKLEQNHQEKPMSQFAMALLTGFVGGILWSGLGYFASVFNFTEVRPNVLLEPWALGDWKERWLGTVISIILIGVLGMVAALIYYSALRKFKNIFISILYGIVLFFLVFFILNPIFPGIEPLNELRRDTIITSVCLYILFGTFVGYSISYEEEEQKLRAKRENEVPS